MRPFGKQSSHYFNDHGLAVSGYGDIFWTSTDITNKSIQVLQEVASARQVLIMCGTSEIDGYAFCVGVDSFDELYRACTELQNFRTLTCLIRGAIFRPDYSMGKSGRSSLNTCSLGELMDMYHAHEASKRHDKVYALLGMSSDNLSKVGLLPDYAIPWEVLMQRLILYLLHKEIYVKTLCNSEIAIIKSKGRILGKVSSVG